MAIRQLQNFVQGQLDSPLSIGGTSMSSNGLSSLDEVISPNYAAIVLDPLSRNAGREIIYVTAHTALATTATVTRSQEGSAEGDHPSGTMWVHTLTALDFRSSHDDFRAVSPGSTLTISPSESAVYDVTLTDDLTVSWGSVVSGLANMVTVIVRQDGTGNHIVTWPLTTLWPTGVEPPLSLPAGSVDVYTFMTVNDGATWFGFPAGLGMA